MIQHIHFFSTTRQKLFHNVQFSLNFDVILKLMLFACVYVCVCRSIFRFIWILFLLYAQLLLLVFPHSMRMVFQILTNGSFLYPHLVLSISHELHSKFNMWVLSECSTIQTQWIPQFEYYTCENYFQEVYITQS